MTPTLVSKYSTYIFDVDSTITSIEGIDELARMKNVYNKVADLTRQSMNGTISFEEVFRKRLELISPTRADVLKVSHLYIQSLSPGIERLIRTLKKQNKDIYLVSGGYKLAIDPVAEHLGISLHNVYANNLYIDQNNSYIGFNGNNPLSRNFGKSILLRDVSKDFVSPTIMIGDGMSDFETKDTVDTFAYFKGNVHRSAVEKKADYIFNSFEDLIK